jgi:hypothetical protein
MSPTQSGALLRLHARCRFHHPLVPWGEPGTALKPFPGRMNGTVPGGEGDRSQPSRFRLGLPVHIGYFPNAA